MIIFQYRQNDTPDVTNQVWVEQEEMENVQFFGAGGPGLRTTVLRKTAVCDKFYKNIKKTTEVLYVQPYWHTIDFFLHQYELNGWL